MAKLKHFDILKIQKKMLKISLGAPLHYIYIYIYFRYKCKAMRESPSHPFYVKTQLANAGE